MDRFSDAGSTPARSTVTVLYVTKVIYNAVIFYDIMTGYLGWRNL